MKIWHSSPIPYSNGTLEPYNYNEANGHIDNVHEPELIPYLIENPAGPRPSVLIFPGGGYGILSSVKEGHDIAEWLNRQGFNAFVLHYRLPIIANLTDRKWVPLSDAQRALRTIRANADKWHVDSDKIGIIGFSAGGHLAASLMSHWYHPAYAPLDSIDSVSAQPNFSLLIYPVITFDRLVRHHGSAKALLGEEATPEEEQFFSLEKHIPPQTGPVFLVHSQNDHGVPYENSILMYQALSKAGIPAELHLYPDGGHGYGLDQAEGRVLDWPQQAENWLKQFC